MRPGLLTCPTPDGTQVSTSSRGPKHDGSPLLRLTPTSKTSNFAVLTLDHVFFSLATGLRFMPAAGGDRQGEGGGRWAPQGPWPPRLVLWSGPFHFRPRRLPFKTKGIHGPGELGVARTTAGRGAGWARVGEGLQGTPARPSPGAESSLKPTPRDRHLEPRPETSPHPPQTSSFTPFHSFTPYPFIPSCRLGGSAGAVGEASAAV